MQTVLVLAFAGAALARAAVVQGVIVDDETGAPLARTQVSLLPLPGQQLAPVDVRVTEHGAFVFVNVHPGWYVLRATRRGFLAAESGQKRAGRPGIPFAVDSQDASQFIPMRMFRLCAIAGTVLDENGVGLPDIAVHVYTAKQPVRHVGHGTTDDRGRFRVDGLDPGAYVVHSAAATLEDDTPLLPTWYKTGTALADAEAIAVRAAETFSDVVIRPTKGTLFRIAGDVVTPDRGPVKLTLITDTGRRVIASSSGPFVADNLPPGPAELVAERADCGAYELLNLQKDAYLRVTCLPLWPQQISWTVEGAPSSPPVPRYPLMARRIDLDGAGPEAPILPGRPLQPGRWEFRAIAGPRHYVKSISTGYSGATTRSADWFEVTLANATPLHIVLSPLPATIQGVVAASGKPVPGAPVFLEWFDPALPDQSLRLFTTRADANGGYLFSGLAPGHYRVVSGYDFDPSDSTTQPEAAVLEVKDGQTASQALETTLP